MHSIFEWNYRETLWAGSVCYKSWLIKSWREKKRERWEAGTDEKQTQILIAGDARKMLAQDITIVYLQKRTEMIIPEKDVKQMRH